MNDREALEAALADDEGLSAPEFDDHTVELNANDAAIVYAFARERLAQLPEKCGTCGGDGSPIVGYPCKDCHGRGTVYPAETVDRIALALADQEFTIHDAAVAVLDALNDTETP